MLINTEVLKYILYTPSKAKKIIKLWISALDAAEAKSTLH